MHNKTYSRSTPVSPIPKVNQPKEITDYRPISITSVLCRIYEKLMIRRFVYPAIQDNEFKEKLGDQYALRPTGSTTAALTSLLSETTGMLQTNDYVRVIALDFSKAFDSIRHQELGRKLAAVPVCDQVYNWVINYISNRHHSTKVEGTVSQPESINASVVQGSAIGPVSYIIAASDLKANTDGNLLLKYADDTYLLVPATNESSVGSELANIESWADLNNLHLNRKKSQELVVHKNKSITLPPSIQGIERVSTLNILGVSINCNLRMDSHISSVVTKANSDLFALKTLRNHGLNSISLSQVCRATLIARMTYASPAWRGFTSVADLSRLEAVERKARRWGLYNSSDNLTDILNKADKKLFKSVLNRPDHVLHALLPPVRNSYHNLRQRGHERQLPAKTNFTSQNFILRMLYLLI